MTARAAGAVLVLILLLLPGAVRAAAPEPARERARTFLMLRLLGALDLRDDEALAVRAVFQKAEERRGALVASRQALDERLRKALARPQADAHDLRQLVRKANAVDRDLAAVAEDSFTEAQHLLTPEQQAKLLLLRYELQGQVRDAMRGRLGQRGHGGPPHGQPKTK